MEILKYITTNYDDFNEKEMFLKSIDPRIFLELIKLKDYLKTTRYQNLLNEERYCIYENYDKDVDLEDGIFIDINYLRVHNEEYLTDSYDTPDEYNFLNNMPCLTEVQESTYVVSGIYNAIHGYYIPKKHEEIYMLQEVIKILCEYPAFQVLECPYRNRNQETSISFDFLID